MRETLLIVDAANVVGSRPDGWWRDRIGATARLVATIGELVGRTVEGPAGEQLLIVAIEAVLEGQARGVQDPAIAGLRLVRAERDGDGTIADLAWRRGIAAHPSGLEGPASNWSRSTPSTMVIVVTADRGLRARLPADVAVAGPRWLLDLSRSAHG